MRARLSAPSPALVIAILALFVALGGGAYAAKTAKKNSVVSKSIKTGAVKGVDIGDGTITGVDISSGALGTDQIDESSLDGTAIPGVPEQRQPFLKYLAANESLVVTSGTFTIKETASGGGGCTAATINPGSASSFGSFSGGNTFAIPPNANTGITAVNGANSSVDLIAATADENALEQVEVRIAVRNTGARCQVWGYVAGV